MTLVNIFFLENSKFAINFLKKKFNNNKKYEFKSYDGKKIPYKKDYFDRIILSHVLEHISDPENFLEEMMMKLKKNGVKKMEFYQLHYQTTLVFYGDLAVFF